MPRPSPKATRARIWTLPTLVLMLFAGPAAGQCLEQRIDNPEPVERAAFGGALWLEDETLVVAGGEIFIYEQIAGSWRLVQRLDDSIPFASGPGWVDFDGERIVAGGSREAFIFVRRDGRFVLEQRLEQPHPDAFSFARSNVVEGDTAVFAELDAADLWVYRRGADGWAQVQRIDYPSDLLETSTFPRYAYNLELADGWLFVSASTADRDGVRRAGVVVAYELQPDGTFANPQVIAVADPQAIEEINRPVMRSGVLAITSRGVDPDGGSQTIAHTFVLEGDSWVYDQAVRGSGTQDRLGATIHLGPDADTLLVGAPDAGGL
ncbi:MAG: hypothetical protein AAFV77_05720, partial [Planctomycetota bacterium]